MIAKRCNVIRICNIIFKAKSLNTFINLLYISSDRNVTSSEISDD